MVNLYGDNLYYSNDYGETWTSDISGNWAVSDMSQDGRIRSITDGTLRISTNYGQSWEKVTSIPDTGTIYNVAMSSNGLIQAATQSGYQIYIHKRL